MIYYVYKNIRYVLDFLYLLTEIVHLTFRNFNIISLTSFLSINKHCYISHRGGAKQSLSHATTRPMEEGGPIGTPSSSGSLPKPPCPPPLSSLPRAAALEPAPLPSACSGCDLLTSYSLCDLEELQNACASTVVPSSSDRLVDAFQFDFRSQDLVALGTQTDLLLECR